MTGVSFTVRNLPKPLHAALTKLAKANRRSINAEVVMAIEGRVDHLHSLRPVRGYVWCDAHGGVHDDSTDPYEDGNPCSPEDHDALFTKTEQPTDSVVLNTTIKRLRAGRSATKRAKGKR